MATISELDRIIARFPSDLRPALQDFAQALLKMRLGHPTGETSDPMVNIQGAFLHGTTPAIAGDEFTIAHGFGRTPYLAVAVMRLDTVGSSVVPLTVSREADDKRIYLTSTIADAPVSLATEG
jgi:hypothetical protein